MYPLHKYQPTPFGKYFLYLDNKFERKSVRSLSSSDIKEAKTERDKDASKHQKQPVPRPYDIRYLKHSGQTVTEPPSNVIIFDDVTGVEGSDLTLSTTWIKERPHHWNQVLKTYEIENPKLTSSLSKRYRSKTEDLSSKKEMETKLRESLKVDRLLRKPTFSLTTAPVKYSKEPIKTAMNALQLPKINADDGRNELSKARLEAIHKRRRRAQKIMNLVSKRAQIASLNEQHTQKLVQTPNFKHLQPFQQTSINTVKTQQRDEPAVDLKRESWKSFNHYPKVREPNIQDWNPKEEQKALNYEVLGRIAATVPYKWQLAGKAESNKKSNAAIMLNIL
ncbi:unnamed protein product [Clavelina lepadiformis]|uniref:Uncharacterized protein n=1 Tax=Clavelina lepadiformis TaxID=159417 RepID=A0ABP0G090_CLALP